MDFQVTTQNQLIYISFPEMVQKEHLSQLEELAQMIEKQYETKIHVLDLTRLSQFDLRCVRPFIQIQKMARAKENSITVVIQPELSGIKKILLDQAAIRPKEICASRGALAAFIKRRKSG